MPDTPSAAPTRRRFRLTVRALMIIVLILGAGPGWLAHLIYRAHVQREAVAAIEKVNGLVFYDYEWPHTGARPPKPWWPNWVESRFGIDFVSSVVEVDFLDQASDRDLAMAGQLPRLQELHCSGPSPTELRLGGLASTAQHTASDLAEIGVSDAGLGYLRHLTRMDMLTLADNPITDAGLVHLTGMKRLRWLDLSGTLITDAGLVHLEDMRDLRSLLLSGCDVSAQGLLRLQALNELRLLEVRMTRVNDFTARDLRKAFPKAKIVFSSLDAR